MTEVIMPKNIASNIRKMFTRSSNVQVTTRYDEIKIGRRLPSKWLKIYYFGKIYADFAVAWDR